MSDKTCKEENVLDKISIDEDEEVNKTHLYKMYYGTISICIIYILISFIILGFGYFTDIGRRLIFGILLPFMVIYIIGSIIVIVYFAEKIRKFEKPKRLPILYQKDSCPDYWKSNYIGEMTVDDVVDPTTVNLFSTKCVLPTDIISKSNLIDRQVNKSPDYPKYEVTNNYIKDTSDINDEKYHLYINAKDSTTLDENSNYIYKYFKNKFPKASSDKLKE